MRNIESAIFILVAILIQGFAFHSAHAFQGNLNTNSRMNKNSGGVNKKVDGTHNNQSLARAKTLAINNNSELLMSVAATTSSSRGSRLASILGYVIGTGSLSLYLPIFLDLIHKGNADGMAIQTWMSSFTSFTLALLYPVKKGFPLSTYVEILALQVQSFIILGTICYFKGFVRRFVVGSCAVLGFICLLMKRELPETVLKSIQSIRVVLDSFTLLPQLHMNFCTKSFRYSEITATMSLIGNALRIFTTLQLVKDPLVLIGYIFGTTWNVMLLLQFLYYGKESITWSYKI